MTDQPSKPTCPHCGRQDCGTAEQIPTWDIVCDTHYTCHSDGSYTTHRGDEHGFGSFARDREDYLLDELVEYQQCAKDLSEEVVRLAQENIALRYRAQIMRAALLRQADPADGLLGCEALEIAGEPIT